MIETMNEILSPAAQVGIIIALAEVIKRLGCPTKYIPLVDLALGLIIGIFVHGIGANMGIINGVMIGLALGLSACGLFSGAKNVFGKGDGIEGN